MIATFNAAVDIVCQVPLTTELEEAQSQKVGTQTFVDSGYWCLFCVLPPFHHL
jgi:hypothetical protein